MPRRGNPKRNSGLARRSCDYRSRTRLNPKYLLEDIQAESYLKRFQTLTAPSGSGKETTDSQKQVSRRSSLKTAIK